jgi:DNA-directed RNA polymerase subunit RPC12/RpoP
MEVRPAIAEWNSLASNLAMFFWGASLLIVLIYLVRLASITAPKDKYDFINKNEITWLWVSAISLITGGCFYGNSAIVEVTNLWIVVRAFVTFALGMIIGLVIQNLLKFYYPFFIEKRLRELRYQPRISPTGRQMKLLTEEAEDAYLDEGMQAEENVFSVDYDVWKDEESGYVKIEKYSGHLHAIECPECNYQTLKVSKEEIISQPSQTGSGQLEKHYQCLYCGHKYKKTVSLHYQNKFDAAGTPA